MNKIDWKRKLTSRKWWLSLTGFITGLIIAFGGSDETAATVKNVLIENKDFEDLIKVYDRPSSFFYLDPPYHTTEKYYDIEFTEDDHKRLASQLSQIQGKFLLSYNDDTFIRELYKDYTIVSLSRNNNMSSGSFKELLIRNY